MELTVTVSWDGVFDDVLMRSLQLSQGMGDGVDKGMDRLAVSEEDRNYLSSFFRRGSSALFSLLSAYGKDVENAYQFSSTEVVYTLELPDAWDINNQTRLADSIQDYLVAYILGKWYNQKGIRHRFEYDLDELESDIRMNIHSRKTTIKRNITLLN